MGEVRITMETMIREMERYMSPSVEAQNGPGITCLISKVKEKIRNVDSKTGDFTPHAVSIGAYHWLEGPCLEAKKEILCHVLRAGNHENPRAELRRYVEEMKGIADRAQKYYCQTEDYNGILDADQFVLMLLLDGLFIVFFLVTVAGSMEVTAHRRRLLSDTAVIRDVFYLLENQVPLFVLEKIDQLVRGASQGDSDLVNNTMKRIRNIVRSNQYSNVTVSVDPLPCHILHLLHMHFRPATLDRNRDDSNNPSDHHDRPKNTPVVRFRAAVYYRANGVRLRARKLGDDTCSILDVTLSHDSLVVPVLFIDDDTWSILRNLTALEQSNCELGSYVTAYCIFLSQLASTAKDVELLSEKGIIVHVLSSDEDVAAGFRRLCKGIVLDINNTNANYLKPTWEAAEKICRSRGRRSMAWMRHRQCNNYAMTAGLMVAAIAFACVVVQTVFTVLSYKK